MIRPRIFLGLLVAVFVATFALAGGLRTEPAGDEDHFLESAAGFQGRFGLEALRTYPEVVTPLALVIWGELDYLTGDGLFYGRLLNLALTFATICMVAFGVSGTWPRAGLAAVGLLLFPYTLPLAAHLYTDTIGVFFVVGGTLALVRGHPVLGWLAFACAISTRQYLVQIPAALAAVEVVRFLRGEPVRWKDYIACVASGLTVIGWVNFFGGLAPAAGIEEWTGHYPAPMFSPTEFLLFQGVYALATLGAYFVVVEALLFRRWPFPVRIPAWQVLLLALGLAVLCWIDPPLLSDDHPGGPLGRVARMLFPAPEYDWVRVTLWYALALLCVLRFAGRIDIGFWLVAASFVLAMKQQIGWEKYLFPTIAVLWTMAALGELSGYRAGTPSEESENSFTKQALPRSGFH
jgi:hypothetical protein